MNCMWLGLSQFKKKMLRETIYFKLERSIFITPKTLRIKIALRKERYLSLRKLLNLPPFRNLSPSVFFCFDLFFRRRRRIVAGNPEVHYNQN